MKKASPPRPRPRRERRRNRFLPLAIGTSGGILLATAAFVFFKQQAERVVEGKADAYDTAIMNTAHAHDSPTLQRTMAVVTQLGSHAAIGTAAGLTAIAMFRTRRRHDAWTVLISTGGAMAINTILKNIFQRKRPQERARRITLPQSHSFPSGHALLAAATYPIVAHHLVQRKSTRAQVGVMSLTGATILAVGFSRVYLGVHFPSDVLGGFAVGLGWLGLTSLSHTFVDRGRLMPPSEPGEK